MKKIFTLVAMALMAVGASAQTLWTPAAEDPGAQAMVIRGDLMTVETVFEGKNGKIQDEGGADAPVSFDGKNFTTYMQVRVNAAPTADVPTGTQQDGSTPLVITAKKNVDITIYYRRQAASDAYNDNDGKDMKIIDQAKATVAIAAAEAKFEDIDGAYANAKKTYNLEEGHTYTLWTRGTTGRLYGIEYAEGTGASTGGETAGAGKYFIAWEDAFSKANAVEYANGFKLQITGNTTKELSNGSKITIDGNQYATIKVSNGAQNTLTLPEGMVAEGITFYSYVNKDAATERDSYWKEVGGTPYEMNDANPIFASYKDADNPDKRTYSFNGDKLHAITFTNTGEQCCYVIEVEIAAGEETTGIRSLNTTTVDVNAPAYNLAGQRVKAGFRGIQIQNGKKIVK